MPEREAPQGIDRQGQGGPQMPPEWDPHEGTWLQWPYDRSFPGYQLQLERLWLRMVALLQERERVHALVRDERALEHVDHQLSYFGIGRRDVELIILPYDDVWAQDNGPTYVRKPGSALSIVNWRFNGWGGRVEQVLDDDVPRRISEHTGVPAIDIPLVIEGGAVEVNGSGTFMGPRSSILNPNRNAELSQSDVEGLLSAALGVSHFIWLSGPNRAEIEATGSFTDQHIDGTARFVSNGTVLHNWTDDRDDFRFPVLECTRDELWGATDEAGRSLALIPLQIPKKAVYKTSQAARGGGLPATPAPASYCNFYLANDLVLVPVYGDQNDDQAIGILQKHFPDREVLGIECVGLVEFGGMIHCVTQQQPTARKGTTQQHTNKGASDG